MNKLIAIGLLGFLSLPAFAARSTIDCQFEITTRDGEKEKSISLGTVAQTIDPDKDFNIRLPANTPAELKGLTLEGSIDTPRKGWIGLAFSSNEHPNTGWASLKSKRGQTLALSYIYNSPSTLEATCSVR